MKIYCIVICNEKFVIARCNRPSNIELNLLPEKELFLQNIFRMQGFTIHFYHRIKGLGGI